MPKTGEQWTKLTLVGSSHKSDRLQNEVLHNPTQFYMGPGELLAEHERMNFFSKPHMRSFLNTHRHIPNVYVLSLIPFINIHTQTFT